METKGRRATRAFGPAEPLPPPVAPAEASYEVVAETGAEPGASPPVAPEAASQIGAEIASEPRALPPDAPDTAVEIASSPSALPAVAAEAMMPRMPLALAAPSARRADLVDFARQSVPALDGPRAALARGLEALSEEVAGLARDGFDAAAHTAIELLGAKTWSDAVAINSRFARTSFEHWIGSSARCFALGAMLAAESSRPYLVSIGESWDEASRRLR